MLQDCRIIVFSHGNELCHQEDITRTSSSPSVPIPLPFWVVKVNFGSLHYERWHLNDFTLGSKVNGENDSLASMENETMVFKYFTRHPS